MIIFKETYDWLEDNRPLLPIQEKYFRIKALIRRIFWSSIRFLANFINGQRPPTPEQQAQKRRNRQY